jgi:hypothetical protein
MDRNLASILALAGTAAVSVTLAAIAPGDAYADDSSRARADVRAELLSQPVIVKECEATREFHASN